MARLVPAGCNFGYDILVHFGQALSPRLKTTVPRFRQRHAEDPKHAADKDYHKTLRQIDKYREKLFADPIQVDTPEGKVAIQPQRTMARRRHYPDRRQHEPLKTAHGDLTIFAATGLADGAPLRGGMERFRDALKHIPRPGV